jgi:Uncharacterized protein conserved in bacteria
MLKEGKKNWYIIDGWLPSREEIKNAGLEGHEAVMVLNCQNTEAEITLDIFYDNREPDEGLKITVPAKRVKCIRMDHQDEIGGVILNRETQYSLRIRSNIEVIVQYGRMDVTQPNLAYIGMMGYSE